MAICAAECGEASVEKARRPARYAVSPMMEGDEPTAVTRPRHSIARSGRPAACQSDAAPMRCRAASSGLSATYTPKSGFKGSDQYVIKVCGNRSGSPGCSTLTYAVTVQ